MDIFGPSEKGIALFMCAIIGRDILKKLVNKKVVPTQLFGDNITATHTKTTGEEARVTYNSWMKPQIFYTTISASAESS